MADFPSPSEGAQSQRSGSIGSKQAGQYPLSCTHCRQRKVKCNKVLPCLPCQRLGLECIFPDRARNPKKKRSGTRTSNEELLARLSRMEQLIGRMEGDGKSIKEEPKHSPTPIAASTEQTRKSSADDVQLGEKDETTPPSDGFNRYIASGFWRSLTSEVEGLRQAVDEESDGEDNSPASNPSTHGTHTSHSSVMFGSSYNTPQNLRPLHPPTSQISHLCEIYLSNVDSVFKVLHAPTLRKIVSNAASNLDDIPTDNYVEPLLFSMYYGAITSLTNEQCLQSFQDGRDSLLSKYRAGVERALTNADFLNTTEMGTLQALTIFLIAVRANDDSQYGWTLTATVVRLARGLELHREDSSADTSPFVVEMRRRLWWQICVLDVRCCEDRASDPLIFPDQFNTKKPLKINDSDIWPEMETPPVERVGFTEMSKCSVSHEVSYMKVRFGHYAHFEGGREVTTTMPFEEQVKELNEVEKKLQDRVIAHCDTRIPIAWVASVVTRLIMCRIRLVIYHPIENNTGRTVRPMVSREHLLETAVAGLEYSHLLDTEPIAAFCRWFTKTYVQWHALATTLAELCVQTEGPLVQRAWRIVDAVFDYTAARIADSNNGMLWRPMKKLMSRAQAKRKQASSLREHPASQQQQQQPLPQFSSLEFNPQIPSLDSPPTNIALETKSLDMSGVDQSFLNNPQFSSDMMLTSTGEDFGAINWAEWDAFMQDFELEGPSKDADIAGTQPEPTRIDRWW